MSKFLALLIVTAIIAVTMSIVSLILSNLAAFILFLAMVAVMRTEEFAIKIIALCDKIIAWAETRENEKE